MQYLQLLLFVSTSVLGVLTLMAALFASRMQYPQLLLFVSPSVLGVLTLTAALF
jgi:hypothetical protein